MEWQVTINGLRNINWLWLRGKILFRKDYVHKIDFNLKKRVWDFTVFKRGVFQINLKTLKQGDWMPWVFKERLLRILNALKALKKDCLKLKV